MIRCSGQMGSVYIKTTSTHKTLVLLPTYNEAANIENMCNRILAVSDTYTKSTIEILVMDDCSPDGTGDIVTELQKSHPGRIHLRSGEKQGLGVAMFRSFDIFLKEFDHDAIVTMDADFSHEPEQIPELLEPVVSYAQDAVVGSRYIEGGLIPGTWPLALIIRTRIATLVARYLGGINNQLHELTTNYRVFTREAIQRMPYKNYNAKGYGFQLCIANYLSSTQLSVQEVPIAFHSRNDGVSKSRISDVIEFFSIAYNLNNDSPVKEVLRFMTIGASGVIINLGSLFALERFTSIHLVLLSLAAIQISILWNFVLHNLYTFRQTVMHTKRALSFSTIIEFLKYELSSLLTQVLTVSVFVTLNTAGIYFVIAQAIGIVVAFVVNYRLARKFIWSIRPTRQPVSSLNYSHNSHQPLHT